MKHLTTLIAFAVCLLPAVAAAPPARCIVTPSPGEFALPDGSRRAGLVKICWEQELTPTTAIGTAYLDGEFAGTFARREVAREVARNRASDAVSSVSFGRNDDGRVQPCAYTQSSDGRTSTFELHALGAQENMGTVERRAARCGGERLAVSAVLIR